MIKVSGPRISATTARTAMALEYGTPFAPSEAAKGPEVHELVKAVGEKERRHKHAANEQGQIVGPAEHVTAPEIERAVHQWTQPDPRLHE